MIELIWSLKRIARDSERWELRRGSATTGVFFATAVECHDAETQQPTQLQPKTLYNCLKTVTIGIDVTLGK